MLSISGKKDAAVNDTTVKVSQTERERERERDERERERKVTHLASLSQN